MAELSPEIKQWVKEYLREHKKKVIVDVFDKGLVAFMDDARDLETMRNWPGASWSG